MMALLQKDLYVIWRTCKYVFVVAMVFSILAGVYGNELIFFSLYAPLLLTSLSMTTLSYDERSKWLQYADALPYGRKAVVISKYLLAILGCLLGLLLTTISYLCFGLYTGHPYTIELPMILCTTLMAGTIQGLIVLPSCFALGVEKGRWIYIFCIVIPLVFSRYIPLPGIVYGSRIDTALLGTIGIAVVVCAVLWFASCRVAIMLYRKRTL